jgi:Kef-type K+ transport system membrane component KefB
MAYTFLVRGYASNDILLWLMILALIALLLGGRWLVTKLVRFIKKKNERVLPTQ